jgi:hypothetical protein
MIRALSGSLKGCPTSFPDEVVDSRHPLRSNTLPTTATASALGYSNTKLAQLAVRTLGIETRYSPLGYHSSPLSTFGARFGESGITAMMNCARWSLVVRCRASEHSCRSETPRPLQP